MRHRTGIALGCLALAAACSKPGIGDVTPVGRIAADPSMGLLLADLDVTRNLVYGQRAGTGGTTVFLQAWGGWREDLSLDTSCSTRVAFVSREGTVSELPAWPMFEAAACGLEAPPEIAVGPLLGGDGLVVAQRAAEGWDVAVLADGAWTAAGHLPADDLRGRLIARSAREVLARDSGRVWLWDGAAWSEFAEGGAHDPMIGPWDGAEPTLVYRDAEERLCLAAFGLDGARRGEPFCAAAPAGALADDSVGGAAATAHLLVRSGGSVRVLYRDGAAWQVGSAVFLERTLATASGPLVACTGGEEGVPACAPLQDGAPGAFFGGYLPRVECPACDRTTDRTCDCVPRLPAVGQALLQDGAAVSLLTGDSVDARLRVYLASHAVGAAPNGPQFPAGCSCPVGWHCVEGAVARCEPEAEDLPDGWARLTGTFTTADPADEGAVAIAVEALDGGLYAVRSGPPDVELEVEVNHAYRITASAVGYESIAVEGSAGDLSPTVLARGLRLGAVVAEQDDATLGARVAVSPAGGALALVAGTRWVLVREDAGGLAVADLGPAPPVVDRPSLPRFAPDGSFLLVPGPADELLAFDGRTGAPLGSLGAPVPFPGVAFAAQAPVVYVPAAPPSAGAARSGTVWRRGEAGFEVVQAIDAVGLGDALSPSGAWLARMEAGEDAVYDLATGERTSFLGAYSNPQGARLQIGDEGPATLMVGFSTSGTCGTGEVPCRLHVVDPATPGMMKKISDAALRFWGWGGGGVFLTATELVRVDLATGATQVLAAGRPPDAGGEYVAAAGPRVFAVDPGGRLDAWRVDTGAPELSDSSKAWTAVSPRAGADLLLLTGEGWAGVASGVDGEVTAPPATAAAGVRFGAASRSVGRIDATARTVEIDDLDSSGAVVGTRTVSRTARVSAEPGGGALAPCFLYRRVESPFGTTPVQSLYCTR